MDGFRVDDGSVTETKGGPYMPIVGIGVLT